MLHIIHSRHMPLFLRRENGYDTELATTCTTIREFDDAITRVAFGTRRPQPLPSNSGLVPRL